LQETLPPDDVYYFYKTRKRQRPVKKYVVLSIVLVFIIFCFVLFQGKTSSLNKTERFYLLSLDNLNTKEFAEIKKDEIDEIVGDSYIYKSNNVFYILGFIYKTKEDSDSMLKEVKKKFPNAKIIIKNSYKIKKGVYAKINRDVKLNEIYNYVLSLESSILNILKNIKEGKEVNVFRTLTKMELSLNNYLSYLSKNDKNNIKDALKVSVKVNLEFFNDCKNDLKNGHNVINNLKILYINLVLEQILLKNSLNNL